MGYDNLKLEKGMYRQEGMNFTQVLESLDPSENYRGTALEGTDAFQRQLKRFGIRAKGAGSSPVEKFFRTMDSAVLFPEYIARTVRQGMEENDILPAITATTTVIDAMDYRSIYSIPTDADKELKDVMEGASIPETAVKTKEHLVQLSKRGRMLVASYEAIRFQKLDLFGVMLRQIGAHIQKQQLADAVNVLISGDGNDNAATQYTIGTSPISGTKGTLAYDQLVEFWGQFDPYHEHHSLLHRHHDQHAEDLRIAESPHRAEFPGHRQAQHPSGRAAAPHLCRVRRRYHRSGQPLRAGAGSCRRRAGGVRQAH